MGPLFSLLLPLFLVSCTIATTAPLKISGLEGEQISFTERDWDWIREATPKHLLSMEKKLESDPQNFGLRANLIRSYSLYADLVFESLALEEKILEERTYYLERSIKLYEKAKVQGEAYLKLKSLNSESKDLSQIDTIALLYLAKSLAALSFHAQQTPALAKTYFDLICKTNPKIEAGECPLFYARFEQMKSPSEALKIYRRFIQDNRYHLLARAKLMEHSLMASKNEEEFEVEFFELEDGIRKWQEGAGPVELNLLNATAKMRFRVLQRYRKRIF